MKKKFAMIFILLSALIGTICYLAYNPWRNWSLNGYRLLSLSSDTRCLGDGNESFVVYPNIRKMGFQNDVIFGYKEEWNWITSSEGIGSIHSPSGYFVFSTLDEKLYEGLIEDEFTSLALNLYGITERQLQMRFVSRNSRR